MGHDLTGPVVTNIIRYLIKVIRNIGKENENGGRVNPGTDINVNLLAYG